MSNIGHIGENDSQTLFSVAGIPNAKKIARAELQKKIDDFYKKKLGEETDNEANANKDAKTSKRKVSKSPTKKSARTAKGRKRVKASEVDGKGES